MRGSVHREQPSGFSLDDLHCLLLLPVEHNRGGRIWRSHHLRSLMVRLVRGKRAQRIRPCRASSDHCCSGRRCLRCGAGLLLVLSGHAKRVAVQYSFLGADGGRCLQKVFFGQLHDYEGCWSPRLGTLACYVSCNLLLVVSGADAAALHLSTKLGQVAKEPAFTATCGWWNIISYFYTQETNKKSLWDHCTRGKINFYPNRGYF